MAITACPECNKEVSDSATTCPHCGFDLDYRRRQEQSLKNWRGLIGISLACAVTFAGYNAVTSWTEQRAAKRALIAEFERRNALTPEQRIAEDNEKARLKALEERRQRLAAEAKAAEEEKKPFHGICITYLKASLHDPASFEYNDTWSQKIDANHYTVWVEGRARNGFGALMLARWQCKAEKIGSYYTVTDFEQLKR